MKLSYATFLQGLSPKPELFSVPVKISDLQLLFSQSPFLDCGAFSPKYDSYGNPTSQCSRITVGAKKKRRLAKPEAVKDYGKTVFTTQWLWLHAQDQARK